MIGYNPNSVVVIRLMVCLYCNAVIGGDRRCRNIGSSPKGRCHRFAFWLQLEIGLGGLTG